MTTTTLEALVTADHRSPQNIARNGARHPVETLEFFGLQPGMTVLEILPALGWYTEILAPYLAEEGRLYLAHFSPDVLPGAEARWRAGHRRTPFRAGRRHGQHAYHGLREASLCQRDRRARRFRLRGGEINANPRDTKDHSKDIWSLPPFLQSGDEEKYRTIGESDRMTLKFRKPA